MQQQQPIGAGEHPPPIGGPRLQPTGAAVPEATPARVLEPVGGRVVNAPVVKTGMHVDDPGSPTVVRSNVPGARARKEKSKKSSKVAEMSTEEKGKKTLKAINTGLLLTTLLGWLAFLLFLAGVAAVTKTARDDSGQSVSSLWGLSWTCLALWLLILLLVTATTIGGMKSAVARHGLALGSRGILFFLTILIAWLGVDCHRTNYYHNNLDLEVTGEGSEGFDVSGAGFGSGLDRSRVNVLFAGEILTLIAAFLIALMLLLSEHAHTAARNPDKIDRAMAEAKAEKEQMAAQRRGDQHV